MVLCLMFGITGSVCSLFLRFGRRVHRRVLQLDPNAEVRMPSDEGIALYKAAVSARHLLLPDVYAAADGLKLRFQQWGDVVSLNQC